MSSTTRLFICLIASLILFTLLWPGRVEASRLAACLTNVTVINANDSGAGSLRQALADVCSGGMVDFAAGLANQTITLTSTELSITKTVTITNPNAANLQVSGNNERRVFNIQAGAVVTISSLSIISGTAISDGSCSDLCGGGILVKSAAKLTVNSSTFKGNSAEIGGGIFNDSTLKVNNSIFDDNSATYSGGGIYNSYSSVLIINDSIFSRNSSGSYGAGIYNAGGNLNINHTTLNSNSANIDGGAIGITGGTVTINNSTISSNSASGYGGGIFHYYGELTVNNSTFSGNSAFFPNGYGGGNIHSSSITHLYNNILANSTSGWDCIGSIATNLNNLIEDGSCGSSLSGDPNLGPLQNNGGPTPTHAVLFPSIAIDTGDISTCLATDQRGTNRPIDGNGDSTVVCDLGAFEAPVGPPSPNIQVLGNNILIRNGDITPSLTDHTDFGSAPIVDGAVTRTFIVSNTGVVNLLLTGTPLVTITGDTSDFTLVNLPTTPVSPGNSTSFQIRFDPTTVGLRSANLMIANNDLDGNPYNFTIQGTGACVGTLTVTNNGDNGVGTLRQALNDICSGGTINFGPGLTNQTITLTSAELSITKTVTITNPNAANLKLSGNNARRVFNIEAGTVVTISHLSIISGTVSDVGSGGGILNFGDLILNNITLNGNSAFWGGGILNSGTLTLNNSSVSSNSANQGGGIYTNPSTLRLNNSTISDNFAYNGAGIFNNYGTLHLSNSLIANSLRGQDCYNRGTISTNLNNLIEDGSCSPTLSGDPLLGPLTDNGGATLTHALLPGSPAINAGDNATCLSTDQRGIARPQQGQCDIGAFESRGFTLTRNSGHNQETPIGSPFSIPLEVTITSSAGEPVSGGSITFAGPGSGASTNPLSVTAVISGSTASTTVTANNIVGGPYNVTASTKGTNSINFSLTNTKVTPSVTIASSANPSLFGQTVTFTVIVTSNAGTPTGNLTFVVDGTLQSPVALTDGQATFSTSSLAVGNHTISANYSGDASFNTSSGLLTNGQTVNPLDAPTVQFTQALYITNESVGTSQNLVLTRTGSLADASQVQISLNGGTATAGSDYSSTGFPKTITFGSGVVSQTVPIAISDDTQVEPSETLSLTLSSVSNAVIGAPSSAVLQIEDNDSAAASFKVYLPTVIK